MNTASPAFNVPTAAAAEMPILRASVNAVRGSGLICTAAKGGNVAILHTTANTSGGQQDHG